MEIKKANICVLFLTFLIGIAVSPIKSPPKEEFSNQNLHKIFPMNTPLPMPPELKENQDEEDDWEENYDAKFKTKLLQTGEFHGDEVKAKSGETWLGLFKKGDDYSLLPTRIKIRPVYDIILDGNKGKKTGKGVSVSGKNQPIFLVKNTSFSKHEKINTVFYEKSEDFEGMWINNEFNKTFNLKDASYNLFVTTDKGKGSWVDETSKLVLSDGKTEQIIYSQKRCDDCTWQLIWAGDIDQDGKLDLYLDLHDHYNVTQWRLFLSSKAEKGKLVKEVANFRIVGC